MFTVIKIIVFCLGNNTIRLESKLQYLSLGQSRFDEHDWKMVLWVCSPLLSLIALATAANAPKIMNFIFVKYLIIYQEIITNLKPKTIISKQITIN